MLKIRPVSLLLASLLFITTGTLHFLRPAAFVQIVPPYVPWHRSAVYLSGAAEIAGAIGLWVPGFRRIAGWGLAALLLAVFPANLNMAVNNVQVSGMPIAGRLLWARLPLQLVLIWWVLWSARLRWARRRTDSPARAQ